MVYLIVMLALTGLLAGAAGGMLGIGGSIIMIPALNELFPPDQHVFQAAAMIANFFVAVPSVYRHVQARAIEPKAVARLVPPAMVGVVLGVGVSSLPLFAGNGEARLRFIFAVFLLGLSLHDLWRWLRPGSSNADARATSLRLEAGVGDMADASRIGSAVEVAPSAPIPDWRMATLIAFPTGFIGGLLGIGGGIIAIPLQLLFLKTPIRTAIANSAATILAISFVGLWVKNLTLPLVSGKPVTAALPFALVLGPVAALGALYGGLLTHTLPKRWVQLAFLVLLLVASVRQGHGALADLGWG